MFPADLLTTVGREVGEQCWWVMYTKSRQEKALARDLAGQGVSYYLPLVPHTSLSRGRKITSHIPLFAGYLFLYGAPEHRLTAQQTNRVSRVLEVEQQERFRADLGRISQLIASNAPLTVERRLECGDRVRVKAGPLAGLEGQVIKRQQRSRLLVVVDYLQQGASVQIDDFLLEPI